MAKQGQTPDRSLDGLTAAAKDAASANSAGKGLPPVHLWNPPFCGDLDMRIASDGTWFYMRTPIGRPALVRLFSTILKREDGKHFLVTPVEKVGIRVDDAPFLAVEMLRRQFYAARRGAFFADFRFFVDFSVTTLTRASSILVCQPGPFDLKCSKTMGLKRIFTGTFVGTL
jgi:hypothetical protein